MFLVHLILNFIKMHTWSIYLMIYFGENYHIQIKTIDSDGRPNLDVHCKIAAKGISNAGLNSLWPAQ